MTELMSVCRTAPATPGLVTIAQKSISLTLFCSESCMKGEILQSLEKSLNLHFKDISLLRMLVYSILVILDIKNTPYYPLSK